MITRLAALSLALTLGAGALVGCGADADPAAEDPTASSSPTDETTDDPTPTDEATDGPTGEPAPEPTGKPSRQPAQPGTRVAVADSDFGPMLFDATGQAIYLFDVETTAKPRCYDDCAEAWPPVLSDGRPVAGRGVDGSLLGTTKRTDGTVQVTYGGHPLYFYAHEAKREVKCHDVFLNGGNWYVVRPDGDAAPPG